MLHQNKYSFNLIDLLTTLVIVAIIGLAAINLLQAPLPTPRAVSQVSPEDMGDQFLNMMAGRIEADWSELEAIPDSPETFVDDRELVYSKRPLFGNSNPVIHFAAPSEEFEWDSRFNNRGIFRLTHTDYQNNVNFSGAVKAWKETFEAPPQSGDPVLVNLNIELSWPGELPYGERSRIYRKVRLVRPAGDVIDGPNTLLNIPCGSVWGIEATAPPTLYYFTLAHSKHTFIGNEGEITGLTTGSVEALTTTSNGIYFIYRTPFDLAPALYLIPRNQIDGTAHTPVTPVRIGTTDLIGRTLAGLHYIGGGLWGVDQLSGQVYSVNQLTGRCTPSAHLSVTGLQVGAITMDSSGHVLLAANGDGQTTIYSFESFPRGELVEMMELETTSSVECMAGHPDGSLYLYNGSECWEVNTSTWQARLQTRFIAAISDMAFFYNHEQDYCIDLTLIEHQH